MIRDPIPLLQSVLSTYLRSESNSGSVEIDGQVHARVPWRPHLLERQILRGWYIHASPPIADSWVQRIRRARAAQPKLRIGVAGSEELFENGDFLEICSELNAAVLVFRAKQDSFAGDEFFNSVDDLIYQRRLKLPLNCARNILDRSLARALSESDKARKGVLLEVVVAVLLSQVDGFEVTSVGISNRTQQIDVLIHNRNVGGTLSASPLVIAEVKNWRNPVGTNEYASFLRKLESRHGRAKLGYFVTTARFTSGVPAERRRESKSDTLIVLIDGKRLPSLWRNSKSITAGFEKITMEAAVGT